MLNDPSAVFFYGDTYFGADSRTLVCRKPAVPTISQDYARLAPGGLGPGQASVQKNGEKIRMALSRDALVSWFWKPPAQAHYVSSLNREEARR